MTLATQSRRILSARLWSVMSYTTILFFSAPATTEIYTLSLHDALPILQRQLTRLVPEGVVAAVELHLLEVDVGDVGAEDRKSTRLNSSHSQISYAVFCLKKKIEHHDGAATDTTPRRLAIQQLACLAPAL